MSRRPSSVVPSRARSFVLNHRPLDHSKISFVFMNYCRASSNLVKASEQLNGENSTKARWWEDDRALTVPNKPSIKAVIRHTTTPKFVSKMIERMTVFQEFNRRPTDTIFLSYVPFKATIADLKKEFDKFGISQIRLGRNRFGQSLGYAYIRFKTIGGAADGLLGGKHHGFHLGRRFKIEPVDPSLPILARPTDICISNFTLRLPDPATVVDEVLKEYRSQVVSHTRVKNILRRKTGYLKFDSPDACFEAKGIIDKYSEQNPQGSVVADFCYDEQEPRRVKLTPEERVWRRD